jgi:Zn-dependent alcohol dehydrogenase
MKCRAAVLRGVGEDWEIREVDLDPPHAGEVLVRMAVAGICHSDDHLVTGDVLPTPQPVSLSRTGSRCSVVTRALVSSKRSGRA